MAAGSLPSIVTLHNSQRRLPQYEAGMSFVQYLLDTYGLDKFLAMWRRLNVTVSSERFKVGVTRSVKWQEAYDELFQRAFGADLSSIEASWRTMLKRG